MDAEFAFRLLLLSARDLAYKLCFVSCKEIKSLRIRSVHAQELPALWHWHSHWHCWFLPVYLHRKRKLSGS